MGIQSRSSFPDVQYSGLRARHASDFSRFSQIFLAPQAPPAEVAARLPATSPLQGEVKNVAAFVAF